MVFLQLQFSCNLQSKKYNFFFFCYDCHLSCSVKCERIDASDVKEDAHFESTSLFTLFIVQVFKVQACFENAQSRSVWSTCNLMFLCDHFVESACLVVRSPCSLFLCDHFVKIVAATCYVCVFMWLCCWKCITRLKCDHLLEVWSICSNCVLILFC